MKKEPMGLKKKKTEATKWGSKGGNLTSFSLSNYPFGLSPRLVNLGFTTWWMLQKEKKRKEKKRKERERERERERTQVTVQSEEPPRDETQKLIVAERETLKEAVNGRLVDAIRSC